MSAAVTWTSTHDSDDEAASSPGPGVQGAGARNAAAVPFWVVAAACCTVQVGFGAYPVVVKWFAEGEEFNMAVFSLHRDALCTPFLLLAARMIEGQVSIPRTRKELTTFALLGAAGIGGQQLCFIMGAYYSSPTTASIFQNTIPIWATAFSIALGQEPAPSPRESTGVAKICGFALAIGGAILMNAGGKKASHAGSDSGAAGVLFLVANTCLTGIYLALQKKEIFNASEQTSGKWMARWKAYPVHVTAWCYAFGSVVAFAACFVGWALQLEILQFGPSHPKTNSWILPRSAVVPLTYALLVSSALCYGLLAFANKHAPSSLVSSFWPFQVPVALGLSSLVGLGTISGLQGVGGGLIVIGLLLVVWSAALSSRKERRLGDVEYERLPEEAGEMEGSTVRD